MILKNNINVLGVCLVVGALTMAGTDCGVRGRIRRAARQPRAEVTAIEWGAPWTDRIVISCGRDGYLSIQESKSFAGSPSVSRRVRIAPDEEAALRDAFADLCALRPGQSSARDGSQLLIRIHAGAEQWERHFKAPYGTSVEDAIRKINSHLPTSVRLSVK